MSCSSNRSQCTAENVFAAVASPGCGQFLNPGNFQAEQIIYDTSFGDLINNFGIPGCNSFRYSSRYSIK